MKKTNAQKQFDRDYAECHKRHENAPYDSVEAMLSDEREWNWMMHSEIIQWVRCNMFMIPIPRLVK